MLYDVDDLPSEVELYWRLAEAKRNKGREEAYGVLNTGVESLTSSRRMCVGRISNDKGASGMESRRDAQIGSVNHYQQLRG